MDKFIMIITAGLIMLAGTAFAVASDEPCEFCGSEACHGECQDHGHH